MKKGRYPKKVPFYPEVYISPEAHKEICTAIPVPVTKTPAFDRCYVKEAGEWVFAYLYGRTWFEEGYPVLFGKRIRVQTNDNNLAAEIFPRTNLNVPVVTIEQEKYDFLVLAFLNSDRAVPKYEFDPRRRVRLVGYMPHDSFHRAENVTRHAAGEVVNGMTMVCDTFRIPAESLLPITRLTVECQATRQYNLGLSEGLPIKFM